MADKDKDNLLGSPVESLDPELSDEEQKAADAEAEAAAAKEAKQEEDAIEAKARFLGIAPLVGVAEAPEAVLQEGGPSPSPVGLSKDHRKEATKRAESKAAKKAAAPKAAVSKAATKKASPSAISAAAASSAEHTALRSSTMPGAPRADGT